MESSSGILRSDAWVRHPTAVQNLVLEPDDPQPGFFRRPLALILVLSAWVPRQGSSLRSPFRLPAFSLSQPPLRVKVSQASLSTNHHLDTQRHPAVPIFMQASRSWSLYREEVRNMAEAKRSHKKLVQDAEKRRKYLVKQLKELQKEMETRASQRSYNAFPFGQMEKGIAKILDVFERKLLVKRWAEQVLKRENR
jgi:hypothetical protein